MKTATVPNPPIPKSFAGPSFLAQIFHMKYTLSVPIYRQIAEWRRFGLCLERNTVANWLINSSHRWLEPIYKLLRESMVTHDILHADETVHQILKRSDGKPATSKAAFWLARTTWQAQNPVIYYQSALTRAQAEADKILEGFSGWLHVDGYQNYRNLPGVTCISCLSHIRRKFLDVSAVTGKGHAKEAVTLINKIFAIEEDLKGLTAQERYEKRLELAKPAIDEFYTYLGTFTPMKGKLETAVNYAFNQREDFEHYLEDGRLHCTNNLMEQKVKPVALGRKNHLFSDTEKGGETNGMAYTIIETAKENGLDPFKYLKHLFESMPNLDFENKPELLLEQLPWAEEIQEKCR
jgi:hypothetical protein